MANGETGTGRFPAIAKGVADKASHPYIMLAGLIITASGMFGGVKWGMAEIATVKADSAAAVAEIRSKSDAAIQSTAEMKGMIQAMYQMKIEENKAAGKPVVEVPEKPKERRKIIEVHYNDTLGTGFYMSEDRDTAFIPMPDTLETIRPR